MLRAIDLAMRGRGRAEPNPLVGCVIVKNGRVMGEGFHERFGGAHAEPNALAACAAAGESPAGATAYVTLEPCCHTNKKTPPCVPLLIQARLDRVVIGCLDPNPAVDGQGAAQLRSAGIAVTAPVLEDDARQLIAPFLARVRLKRPYVTLKWAESADGKVAGPGGKPVRISNEASTRAVHELRGRCDAIMVGIGTVLADDPLLTARGVQSPRVLRRVVLDSRLRIPIGSRLVRGALEYPLVVYGYTDSQVRRELADILFKFGVEVHDVSRDSAGRPSLLSVLGHLDVGITHLLVEPGPELARSFFRESLHDARSNPNGFVESALRTVTPGSNELVRSADPTGVATGQLVDRVWVFRSPMRIDDATAPGAARIPDHFLKAGELDLNGDHLTEYLNPASEAFFKNVASADLRYRGSVSTSRSICFSVL
jgi:diaminohydroxyphosphoribosylaminopyrimidine deaminase/5-amino-6-(5-phosphoribosylamino)uracil reductase